MLSPRHCPSHSYFEIVIVGGEAAREVTMYDVIFVALGIAGFAACLGYLHLCERL